MLQKIGRWGAARLQGTQGKEKYDDWMQRNPWASTALKVGDVALAAYAAPKAIGGLKGLLSGKGAAVAGKGATAATQTAPMAPAVGGEMGLLEAKMQAAQAAGGAAPVTSSPAATGMLDRVQQGARGAYDATMKGAQGVYDYAKKNPLASAMALEGLLTGSQNAQTMRMQREQMRMEQQRREQLAQLLMPLFAQYYQGG
jgi:hypothetical protein